MKVWMRSWHKWDIEEVARHLLVIGLGSAECFACRNIGMAKTETSCPECGTQFRFIGLRNKATHRDLENVSSNHNSTLIDFEDFSKEFNRNKAKRFLDSA